MKLRHFSIRDLLWLFVVVAFASGWAVDRMRLVQSHRKEAEERARSAAIANFYTAQLSFLQTAPQRVADVMAGETNGYAWRAKRFEPAELRTWSRGDFTLEARFVRIDGENVILRKSDGSEVSVPLKELSPVDQCVATMAGPAGSDVP